MDLSSLLFLTSVGALTGSVVYQCLDIRDRRISHSASLHPESIEQKKTEAVITPISFHVPSPEKEPHGVYQQLMHFFTCVEQGNYHHGDRFDLLIKEIICTPYVNLYIFDIGDNQNQYIFYYQSHEICQLFDENQSYTAKFSEKNQKMNSCLTKHELTKVYLALYKMLKLIKIERSNHLEKSANLQELTVESKENPFSSFDACILSPLSDVYKQIAYLDEHQEQLDTVQHHQYIRLKNHVFPLILSTYQELTEKQREEKKETFIHSLNELHQTFSSLQEHLSHQQSYNFDKAVQLLKES